MAPLIGFGDHEYELGDHMFIAIIKLTKGVWSEISQPLGDIKPTLHLPGFGFCIAKFCNKGRPVTAFSPCFRDVGTNRSGCAAHLVCQYIAFGMRQGQTMGMNINR